MTIVVSDNVVPVTVKIWSLETMQCTANLTVITRVAGLLHSAEGPSSVGIH